MKLKYNLYREDPQLNYLSAYTHYTRNIPQHKVGEIELGERQASVIYAAGTRGNYEYGIFIISPLTQSIVYPETIIKSPLEIFLFEDKKHSNFKNVCIGYKGQVPDMIDTYVKKDLVGECTDVYASIFLNKTRSIAGTSTKRNTAPIIKLSELSREVKKERYSTA